MGYESSVFGVIKMTREAFDKMMAAPVMVFRLSDGKMEPSTEPMADCYENFKYDDDIQYLDIDSNGKHYHIDDHMAHISKFKDVDSLDVVNYAGDDTEDKVVFLIGKGFYLGLLPFQIVQYIAGTMTDNLEEFKSYLIANKLSGNITFGESEVIRWLTRERS